MNIRFINNLKLRTKLLLGFGIILVIMIGVTLTAVLGMTKGSNNSTAIVNEHLPQLSIASEVAELAKDTQYVVQAYTSSEDSQYFLDARANIQTMSDDFQKLKRIPASGDAARKLQTISSNGLQSIEQYSSLLSETETTIEALKQNRQDLDARASEFIEKSNEILETFTSELEMEIESGDVIVDLLGESLGRITTVNSIIGKGQDVFTQTWQGIVVKDQSMIETANADFEQILVDLQKAKDSTMDFYIRGLVDEIIAVCSSYQEVSAAVVKNWTYLAENLDGLTTVGNEIGEITHKFSNESMASVTKDSKQNQTLLTNSRNIVIILTGIALLLGVAIAFFITYQLTSPMKEISRVVEAIAVGDLTKESTINQTDEIGMLGISLNQSLKKLRGVMGETSGSADILAQSAIQLNDTASTLLDKSTEMNDRSTTVAAAGEQLSANIGTMATTAEELSGASQSVASAVEEMNASINEVAKNCAKESDIAGQANREAESARVVMSELGNSANEISKIVEIINNIAAQTNLLALNATIEAASAGDAGKGFAVVANEVKELARQSAQATEQISKQIEEMQSKATTSINTIESITTIIEEVNNIAITIASAVEEQSVTTNEISDSLSGVSQSIHQLASNIQQAAGGANEVSENIQQVSFAAKESVEGANNTSSASSELTEIAETLRRQVGAFTL